MDMAEPAKALVSVIVPVYNVEAYMDRCVASLCGQSYDKIEIVLVDDGSTDGSGTLNVMPGRRRIRGSALFIRKMAAFRMRAMLVLQRLRESILRLSMAMIMWHLRIVRSCMKQLLRNDADMALCNLSYVWPSKNGTLRPYYHRLCHSKEERVLSSERKAFMH
jgi:cellulose synthase/poly-beta-1,6-N-acetylglucosamine synthase-like glycosyltransferase